MCECLHAVTVIWGYTEGGTEVTDTQRKGQKKKDKETRKERKRKARACWCVEGHVRVRV